MNPLLAAFICVCGIAGLFYLDRDKTIHTSKALWLPVVYCWIIGSRPVSVWLGIGPQTGTEAQLNGSPFDAAIFGILLIAAICVLLGRKNKTRTLLLANWPILIYFSYCLISATWSSHPDISVKRWIKATSDLAMVLIVVTDGAPGVALRRMISRIGFLLLPTSLLFIKYFPSLGRSYTPSGLIDNTGVTNNKNLLGVLLLVISLGALWQILTLMRAKGRAGRGRHLCAQSVLLAFGCALLKMAHSATSVACFILGGGLILATSLRAIRGRPFRVHALCLALVVSGGLTFIFAGRADMADALGRSSNLSGRTDIWAALIPTVPSSIVGAGYESYWISPSAEKLWSSLSEAGWWHPEILVTEAHNGYIEVYLNLGWIGVALISLILMTSYKQAVAAIRLNPSIGSLTLAYVIVSAVYSITEAGFRSPDPMWIFLLLASVSSSAAISGFFRERVRLEFADSGSAAAAASGVAGLYRSGWMG